MLLGIFALLVGINIISASLCQGYNGLYYDCNNYNNYGSYNTPSYTYKSSYIDYDGYNYNSRSTYSREYGNNYYNGKYYEEMSYNVNRYYPYYSYKTSSSYTERNLGNRRYVEESYVKRKLSHPEARLVLWTYR